MTQVYVLGFIVVFFEEIVSPNHQKEAVRLILMTTIIDPDSSRYEHGSLMSAVEKRMGGRLAKTNLNLKASPFL